MTTYRVAIARREGNVDGWVLELQGCRAIGSSMDEVHSLLPVVTAEYVSWLRGHGETPEEATSFDVVEEVEPGAGDFAFEADKQTLTEPELDACMRLMSYAHQDLLMLVESLSAVLLDWKPPASSVRIDATYPDVRTIREMIDHVRTVEPSFYVRSVTEPDGAIGAPPAPPELTDVHDLSESALRSLSAGDRSRVFERPNSRGAIGLWTARKVIRRAINHKRFHTREIEQRLCWLTLGLPEVLPLSRE
jgi:hypothetical protein